MRVLGLVLVGALVLSGCTTTGRPLPAECLTLARIPAEQACLGGFYQSTVEHGQIRSVLSELSKSVRNGTIDDCHLLAHGLGWAAVRGGLGLRAAMDQGTDVCLHGYLHGVAEEWLTEHPSLSPTQVCADVRDSQQGPCVHGVGHGLLKMEAGNVTRASDACDRLGSQWAEVCLDGALMENSVRLFGLDEGSYAQEAPRACDAWQLGPAAQDACWMNIGEGAMFYYRHVETKGLAVCDDLSGAARDQCRHGAMDESLNVALERKGG